MSKNKYTRGKEGNPHHLRVNESTFYNDSTSNLSKCKQSIDNPGKKKSWSSEEDAYLIKLVQKYGAQKWTSIAQNLQGLPFLIQGGLESNVDRDGIIILILKSRNRIGVMRRNGYCIYHTRLWEIDGLKLPNTYQAGLTIPLKIIGIHQ